MALDFAQILEKMETMAQTAQVRLQNRQDRLAEVVAFLHEQAHPGEVLERYQDSIQAILRSTQPKPFRGTARPLGPHTSLDATFPFDPRHLPPQATLVGADGSQIIPDRHAPFVYYLIHIGGLIYFHGQNRPPQPFTYADLQYPQEDELEDERYTNHSSVTLERDLAEIGVLAKQAELAKEENIPLLAIVDQRLLYFPAGEIAPQYKERAIKDWQEAFNDVRRSGGWLVGYIDRPMKNLVLTMLRGLHPDFDPERPDKLGDWEGLRDAYLFAHLLRPGERSAIFADVSFANERFKGYHKENEICFFYLNTGREETNIARVDMPLWVAQNPAAVNAIHALLYDQCLIMGSYPYVLTRADEIAVVTKQDQEEVEFRLGVKMAQYGHEIPQQSAKSLSKVYGRSGKQRFEI